MGELDKKNTDDIFNIYIILGNLKNYINVKNKISILN